MNLIASGVALSSAHGPVEHDEGPLGRLYRRVAARVIATRRSAWTFLIAVGVAIGGAVTTDTVMTWTPQAGVAAYRVWWRDTTAPQWQHSRAFAADADPGHAVLKNIDLDDFFFGVSAVSADGWESPVTFPGDAGSF